MLQKAYEELTNGVIDAKVLSSGVIGGVGCEHLAFRKQDVDYQIWIAQGDRPYPCRYVIIAKEVLGSPQYSVQISEWETGTGATGQDFTFLPPAGARFTTLVELKAMKDMGELPSNFVREDNQ